MQHDKRFEIVEKWREGVAKNWTSELRSKPGRGNHSFLGFERGRARDPTWTLFPHFKSGSEVQRTTLDWGRIDLCPWKS